MNTDNKAYKKLVKNQQSNFIKDMFRKLENNENTHPREYYNLIRSLRSGSFDKPPKCDTDCVSPQDWQDHFKSLLGPDLPHTAELQEMLDYVGQSIHHHRVIRSRNVPLGN